MTFEVGDDRLRVADRRASSRSPKAAARHVRAGDLPREIGPRSMNWNGDPLPLAREPTCCSPSSAAEERAQAGRCAADPTSADEAVESEQRDVLLRAGAGRSPIGTTKRVDSGCRSIAYWAFVDATTRSVGSHRQTPRGGDDRSSSRVVVVSVLRPVQVGCAGRRDHRARRIPRRPPTRSTYLGENTHDGSSTDC